MLFLELQDLPSTSLPLIFRKNSYLQRRQIPSFLMKVFRFSFANPICKRDSQLNLAPMKYGLVSGQHIVLVSYGRVVVNILSAFFIIYFLFLPFSGCLLLQTPQNTVLTLTIRLSTRATKIKTFSPNQHLVHISSNTPQHIHTHKKDHPPKQSK